MATVFHKLIRFIDSLPILNRLLAFLLSMPYVLTLRRKRFALSYYREKLNLIPIWARKKTENFNFYYELTEHNFSDLAWTVSAVCGMPYEKIMGYMLELKNDSKIREHISNVWQIDPSMTDAEIGFGRRYGWYAFTRALKPKIVVETGVHQGVGAVVICAALERNLQEGFEGKYFGTDIDLEAGSLLTNEYARFGEILYGDSLKSLEKMTQNIDIFINDSDHSKSYEALEYECVKNRLTQNSVILGDNSHVSEKLSEFSSANNRKYLFFRENPIGHWYPGGGIGISIGKLPLLN